jgi:hypothetical protein
MNHLLLNGLKELLDLSSLLYGALGVIIRYVKGRVSPAKKILLFFDLPVKSLLEPF